MTSQITQTLREEFFRKSIHLLSIVVPIADIFLDKNIILGIIVLGFLIAVVVEWQRRRESAFSRFFYKWLGPLLRESEKSRLTASTLLIIGTFFCVLLFPKNVAIFCLLTLIISDAFAALIGRSIGTHSLYLNKTWEGTLTFFVCTLLISIFTLQFPILGLIFLSIIISVIELVSSNTIDNIVLPLASGIVVLLLDLII